MIYEWFGLGHSLRILVLFLLLGSLFFVVGEEVGGELGWMEMVVCEVQISGL